MDDKTGMFISIEVDAETLDVTITFPDLDNQIAHCFVFSPEQARKLGERLIKNADDAERLAKIPLN